MGKFGETKGTMEGKDTKRKRKRTDNTIKIKVGCL